MHCINTSSVQGSICTMGNQWWVSADRHYLSPIKILFPKRLHLWYTGFWFCAGGHGTWKYLHCSKLIMSTNYGFPSFQGSGFFEHKVWCLFILSGFPYLHLALECLVASAPCEINCERKLPCLILFRISPLMQCHWRCPN